MRCSVVMVLLLVAPFSWSEEPFPVAITSDLQVEAFEDPAQIWLPSNYDEEKKWPTMVYYHGTFGQPTIEFLRLLTGGKDWVLIGMGYKQAGEFQYTEEALQAEIDIYHSTIDRLKKRIRIDPERIYFSGFSKGGWLTGLMLQKIPELAGGMIMGGGFIQAIGGRIDPNDHVYIGVGDLDGNVAMSYGARRAFKSAGCDTIIDFWEGHGHQLPNAFHTETCLNLRQWLSVEAGITDQEEAIHWFDGELRRVRELENTDRVKALHLLIRLSSAPWGRIVDEESKKQMLKKQSEYGEDESLRVEIEAWTSFGKAIALESRDRYVSTLAESLGQYNQIAQSWPDTKFGKKAAASSQRIKTTLGLE